MPKLTEAAGRRLGVVPLPALRIDKIYVDGVVDYLADADVNVEGDAAGAVEMIGME